MIYPEQKYACEDPQVGPHNRCRHPVAVPPGTKRCAGDPGCPFRLPVGGPDLCPGCADLAAIRLTVTDHRELVGLMGGR